MKTVSLMGGTGFIGSRYAQLYPQDTIIEPRNEVKPSQDEVLYTISTTSNYGPLMGDLKTDIQTNLLHLAEVLPNVRGTFTFLSSWFSYGGADHGHHPAWRAKEHHLSSPNGFYSITKLAAEQLIRSYVETVASQSDGAMPGPRAYRILRLSNVIGNDPRAGKQKNALEHLLKLVLAGEDVPIYEGTCYRDVLHIDDTCRAIRACMDHASTLNQIVNIGRGESHRMEDLIAYAIKTTGSRSQIVRIPVPAFHKVVQVSDIFLDTSKLRALGWEPQYTVWESVDRVIEGLTRAP